MKLELYRSAKYSVLHHTEIDEELLLNSNKEECVDARCLLVSCLSKCGLKDADIAELTHLTRAGVCKLRNSFSRRGNRMFIILWKRICSDVDSYMKQGENEVL